MIKSLHGMALRFFKENKLIAMTSIIGVVFSISLIITISLFMSNAKESLVLETQKMFGEMDLAVGYNPGQEKAMTTDLLSAIESSNAIEESSSILLAHMTIDNSNTTFYTVGVENSSLAKSRYHFTQDISEGEVILNKGLAKTLNVSEGDALFIENKSFIVQELISDLEAAGVVTDNLILSLQDVQNFEFQRTGIENVATYILIKLDDQADAVEVATKIKEVDGDLRIDIAEENEFLVSNLEMLSQFVLILSFLVLIITSLFIISNFEVFLYKYKNQLAIMRALGASKRQIFEIIFLQCTVINVVGALGAVFLSFITHQFLQGWMSNLFAVDIVQANFNFILALTVAFLSGLIIQVFMFVPAYRSSKVLPIIAMQENESIDFRYQTVYNKIGYSLLGVGTFGVLLGLLWEAAYILVVYGMLLFMIGLFILFPYYISPILRWSLPFIKKVFGNVSFITVKNIIPQVRQNILIVFVISAMLMIAVFGSTFIQTLKDSDKEYVKSQFTTDIVLTGPFSEEAIINITELQNDVKELPAIQYISTISSSSSGKLFKGDMPKEISYSYADLEELEKQEILSSTIEVAGNKIVMNQEVAEQHQIEIGDQIDIELLHESELATFTVVGITEELPNWEETFIDWEANVKDVEQHNFARAFITAQNIDEALDQLEGIKGQFPGLNINSYKNSLAQSEEMFVQRWTIFIAVLVIILFSTMLGVVNTLVNNINSRRKEYAVLRAISLDNKGIIQVVLTQVIVYITIGILFGVFSGVGLIYALSLIDQTPLIFDYKLIFLLILTMYLIVMVVFIPFANKISRLSISEELTKDNK